MIRRDVVVVGGGFAGLAAAAAFAQKGARVTVLEAHAGHDPRFRGELIHPRGVRALEALGLKQPLVEAGGVPVRGFAVSPNLSTDNILLPYEDDLGDGLGIEHRQMVSTLRACVEALPDVELCTGARVDALLEEAGRVVGVRTAGGEEFRGDLVVGADGRQSRLRALLGLSAETQLLSYTVALSVEGEVLRNAGRGHVFLGAPGPILAYPYGVGLVRMCIDIPLGAPKGKANLKAFVAERYTPFLPQPLRAAMLRALEQHGVEGCANQAVYTQQCAVRGAVLVGDAGGCSHPLTAGGMTIGMNDVVQLVDVLERHGTGEAALLEYQRLRYRFARTREIFTEALYEIFRGLDAGSLALQSGIFRYWRSSERSRRASMGILSGDENRAHVFMTEYARVMGSSAVDVAAQALTELKPVRSAQRLSKMLRTSLKRLDVSARRTVHTVLQERRMGLEPGAATAAAA